MSLKTILTCAGIGIASLAAMGEINVDCDRPSHVYRVGETAIFRIASPAENMVDVELSCDGEAVLQTLQVKTPAEVPFALSMPGVLRCTVQIPGQKRKMCGVAFAPEQIQAALPEPEDFSAVFPIYNALNGPKLLFNKVKNGHGDAPIEYEGLTWCWVAGHLQLEL